MCGVCFCILRKKIKTFLSFCWDGSKDGLSFIYRPVWMRDYYMADMTFDTNKQRGGGVRAKTPRLAGIRIWRERERVSEGSTGTSKG